MNLSDEDREGMVRDAENSELRDACRQARHAGPRPTFEQYLEWITEFSRHTAHPDAKPWPPGKEMLL